MGTQTDLPREADSPPLKTPRTPRTPRRPSSRASVIAHPQQVRSPAECCGACTRAGSLRIRHTATCLCCGYVHGSGESTDCWQCWSMCRPRADRPCNHDGMFLSGSGSQWKPYLQDAVSSRIASSAMSQHTTSSPEGLDHGHDRSAPAGLPEAVAHLLPISLWSGEGHFCRASPPACAGCL